MKNSMMESVLQADKVLIGIGTDFDEKFNSIRDESFVQLEKEDALEAGYRKLDFLQKNQRQDCLDAYEKLFQLVKDKDYFVVTLCKDDLIYKTSFDESKVVAPCGNFRFLQCSKNCSNELLPITESMIVNKEKITCPHCGSPACFNQIGAENYNENGYLPQWDVYGKWLQKTINRKLCILELGVGMQYPTVIRWAFEKVLTYNEKATMYRVHDTLYQYPIELAQKGVSIQQNPIEFINAI